MLFTNSDILVSKLEGFEDLKWDQKIDFLGSIRKSLQSHEGRFIIMSSPRQVGLVAVSSINNLRSAVSKSGILTLSELFISLGRVMDAEVDITLPSVICKASEGSKFIRQEALKLLHTIGENVSPRMFARALLDQAQSNNARKRCLVVTLLFTCLERSARRLVSSPQIMVRLVPVFSRFLSDKLPEARTVAREAIVSLRAILGRARFFKLLHKTLSDNDIRAVRALDTEPDLPLFARKLSVQTQSREHLHSAPPIRRIKQNEPFPNLQLKQRQSLSPRFSRSSELNQINTEHTQAKDHTASRYERRLKQWDTTPSLRSIRALDKILRDTDHLFETEPSDEEREFVPQHSSSCLQHRLAKRHNGTTTSSPVSYIAPASARLPESSNFNTSSHLDHELASRAPISRLSSLRRCEAQQSPTKHSYPSLSNSAHIAQRNSISSSSTDVPLANRFIRPVLHISASTQLRREHRRQYLNEYQQPQQQPKRALTVPITPRVFRRWDQEQQQMVASQQPEPKISALSLLHGRMKRPGESSARRSTVFYACEPVKDFSCQKSIADLSGQSKSSPSACLNGVRNNSRSRTSTKHSQLDIFHTSPRRTPSYNQVDVLIRS